uniref:Uncharacterized protein n=1 Tax=Arundo donax TaxID=35708 RepID=A0A0A8YPZ2_ARUDO
MPIRKPATRSSSSNASCTKDWSKLRLLKEEHQARRNL